ncbi:DUF1786 domain-containing protein [Methanofollis fontis]|uniref:Pyruvate formate lyase-activating protein n=1 Tax=Methanofollis fontis TaxID=2052832 RepID=A0A483CU22_9EURY|nr:DUF1786 domain-containing protein [Methanofollis fontis]TAJ44933.1 pyruvate formate lyase-activating protein [Methanofollis fontis]
MSDRRILAVDVGRGTQDILIYDPDIPAENSFRLVLPSPTVIVGNAIRSAAQVGRPVHLEGTCMGGGGSVSAVMAAIGAGLSVTASPEAAPTIHDDPERVQRMGVRVTDEPAAGAMRVRTGDYMEEEIRTALSLFGVTYPEQVAVAVQDHGYSPKVSNRLHRFEVFRDLLESGDRDLYALAPDPPHPSMTRMQAVLSGAPGALVTDTGPAAAIGALLDPWVAERAGGGITIVNAGNGHTLCFTLRGTCVCGMFEHHTAALDTPTLKGLIRRLQEGTLTNREVFDDGGHGAAMYEAVGQTPVAVTGPNRRRLLPDAWQAAAYGDMMLTGSFGLVEIWKKRRDG